MLELIVRNFQSVEDVNIKIKGFTTIKGQSNCGKSSTFKALYAATHNRFTPAQVRFGTEAALIKLRWDGQGDVLSVVRRPEGSPTMKLGGHETSKLNRDVPLQVENFNNFGQLKVGQDIFSLNFYPQFQKPLLLEFSQKKVMEILSASKALDDMNKVHFALSKLREQNRGAFNAVDNILTKTKADISIKNFIIQEAAPKVSVAQVAKKKYDESELKLNGSVELLNLCKTQELQNKKSVLLDKAIHICEVIEGIKKSVEEQSELNQSIIQSKLIKNKIAKLDVKIKFKKDIELTKTRLTELNILRQDCHRLRSNKACRKVIDLSIEAENTLAKLSELEELYKNCALVKSNLSKIEFNTNMITKVTAISTIKTAIAFTNQLVSNYMILTQDVNVLNSNSKRLEEIENIINNKLCPCCGQAIH